MMDVNIIYNLSTREVLSFKPRMGFGVIYRYDFPSLSERYITPSYIGLTRQPIAKRHSQHISAVKTNNIFNNTLTSHDFVLRIVELCSDSLLNEEEIFWISKSNTLYPNGLNYDKGGKRKEMTIISRKKLSSSLKTVFNQDNHRKMRSNRASAQWQDPAMREKMIKGMKEKYKPRSEEYMTKIRTPVMQLSLDGRFVALYPSITQASKDTGIAREQIRDTVNGKQHTCKGFKFVEMVLGR